MVNSAPTTLTENFSWHPYENRYDEPQQSAWNFKDRSKTKPAFSVKSSVEDELDEASGCDESKNNTAVQVENTTKHRSSSRL